MRKRDAGFILDRGILSILSHNVPEKEASILSPELSGEYKHLKNIKKEKINHNNKTVKLHNGAME